MVWIMEDDGAVANIISLIPGSEASIESEPC